MKNSAVIKRNRQAKSGCHFGREGHESCFRHIEFEIKSSGNASCSLGIWYHLSGENEIVDVDWRVSV